MRTVTENKPTFLLVFFTSLVLTLPFFFQIDADPDLWWHLASGVHFLKTGHFAYQDLFSYTFAGAPWINHEWLWEVLVSASFLLLGEFGLFCFRNFLLLIYLAALVAAYRRLKLRAFYILFLVWLTFFYTARYFILRPHAFSYLFCLSFFLVCDQKGPKAFVTLALLMLFWVNIHGGFLFGLGIAALFAIDWRRQKLLSVREAFAGWLALAAISILTPYGWRLYPYLWKELSSSHDWISEWQPLFDQPQAGLLFCHYAIFAVLPLILLALHRRPEKRMLKMLWLATAILPIIHRRFFVLLVLFGSLELALELGILLEPLQEKTFEKIQKNISYGLTLIFCFFSILRGGAEFRFSGFHLRQTQIFYPRQAVAFLKTHRLGSKLALPVHWGGYAIWTLWPGYKVSIDGRYLTVYPRDYVPHQLEAERNGDLKGFLGPVEPDVVLVANQSRIRTAIHEAARWKMVYQDGLASVFVKHGAGGMGHGV